MRPSNLLTPSISLLQSRPDPAIPMILDYLSPTGRHTLRQTTYKALLGAEADKLIDLVRDIHAADIRRQAKNAAKQRMLQRLRYILDRLKKQLAR